MVSNFSCVSILLKFLSKGKVLFPPILKPRPILGGIFWAISLAPAIYFELDTLLLLAGPFIVSPNPAVNQLMHLLEQLRI